MLEWLNKNFNGLTLLISLLLFGPSVVIAYFYGFVPRKRKAEADELREKINRRNLELVALYQDIQALITIEDYLCQDLGVSKQKAREGFTISRRCERKRIEKRIVELEEQLKKE